MREPRTLLATVALVPLLWVATHATSGRHAVVLGWLHGTVHWLLAIPWLVGTLETFGGLPTSLAAVLVGALCLYLGGYHAAWSGGVWLLWRRGGAYPNQGMWFLVALPALWVVLAWLRGHAGVLAFPWNLAGYAWVEMPGALPSTAWIGSHGLSFLLVLANVGGLLLVRRRFSLGLWAILAPLLILAGAGRWSVATLDHGHPPQSVVVVQPSTPVGADTEVLWAGYQRLQTLSTEACEGGDQPLVVWPESAAFPFDYERSPQLRRDTDALARAGCPVLLNSPMDSADGPFNAALLIDRDGVAASYAKRRLVPWGEYVPLGDVFPWLGKVARIHEPFVAGDDLGLMPWGREQLGVAICFEVIFPAAVAQQSRAGATVLATITNDAWYGDTQAPWQHFRAARFRAAENRRPLVRAALTGVSGLIDARGRVVAQLGVDERDVLRGSIMGSTSVSPYARTPWLVPLLCLGLTAFAIIPRRRR